MITKICRECRNFFAIDRTTGAPFGVETGDFSLVGNKVTVNNKYLAGQYIAIQGSLLNDGVYQVLGYADDTITLAGDTLTEEEWVGTVYILRIPKDFLQEVDRVKAFVASDAGQASNITSASFGIQSVSYGVNGSGAKAGWKDVFRNDLNKYRRMFPDIEL